MANTQTSSAFSTDNQYIKYRIVVTENSTSVASNSSNVTIKVQAWRTNTGYETYGTGTCFVTIDGKGYSQAITTSQKITYNSYTTLFTKTIDIAHNANGTKAIYASAYITHSRFSSSSQGFSVSLTNIPRYGAVTSATDFSDEENPTIGYDNSAGSAVTSIQACISLTGDKDDIPYRDIPANGSTYTFELTDSERNTLLTACTGKSMKVYFYVKTILNGQTFYSNRQARMSVVNANPTIGSVTYEDINSETRNVTQDPQYIVRGKSTLKLTLTGLKALKKATLTTATATINGVTKSFAGISGDSVSSVALDFGTVNVSSDITADIVLTDSRGFSTTYKKTIKVYDYQAPYANISLQRKNNFYSETDLKVDCTYSSLGGNNSVSIKAYYKRQDASDWEGSADVNNHTATTLDLNNEYAWDVRIEITDKLTSTPTTYDLEVDKGIPIVFFDRLLSSVGINCFPTGQGTLEVNGTDVIKAIQGEVLYSGKTQGTITLSKPSTSFARMEIIFVDNDGTYGSVMVYNASGKLVNLMIDYPYLSGSSYIKSAQIQVSGSQITWQSYASITLQSRNFPIVSNTNNIWIVKAIGFAL